MSTIILTKIEIVLLIFLPFIFSSSYSQDSTQTGRKFAFGGSAQVYYSPYWNDIWTGQFEFILTRKIKNHLFSFDYNLSWGRTGKKHPILLIEGFVTDRVCNTFNVNMIHAPKFLSKKLPISIGTGLSVRARFEDYLKYVGQHSGGWYESMSASRFMVDAGINLFLEYRIFYHGRFSLAAKANYKYFITGSPTYGIGLNAGFAKKNQLN